MRVRVRIRVRVRVRVRIRVRIRVMAGGHRLQQARGEQYGGRELGRC